MNQSKNIFLAAQIYPPETGGAAIYFSQIAHILKDTDKFNPIVVTGYLENESLIQYDNEIPVIRICSEKLNIIDKYDFPLDFIDDKLNITPDLLHIHPHLDGKEAFFRGNKANDIPIIYDYRGISARINEAIYGDYKYYFSVTEEVDQALLKRYSISEEQIFRSPVTVNTDNVGETISHNKNKFRAIMVATLHKHKGLDIAIEAIKNSSNELDIEFLIIGDGPQKDLAKEANDKYEFIKYLGRLNHKNTLAEIKEADILLVPSELEGDPRVVLEALTLGTPVIGTDVGTIKNRVEGAGLIVDRNSNSFARAISEIYNNKDLYTERAISWNNKHNKTDMKEIIINAYNEILENKYS